MVKPDQTLFNHNNNLLDTLFGLWHRQELLLATSSTVVERRRGGEALEGEIQPLPTLVSLWARALSVATLVAVSAGWGSNVWGCSEAFTSLIRHLRSVRTPGQLLER